MIGSTISHFTVTSKLGEGGMGEVYRATDTKLNRDVALKTLPDGFYLDEQRMGRFTREAQVLASLSGGAPIALTEAGNPYGATWTADGWIVYAECCGGILRVSEHGGDPEPITEVDIAGGEDNHRLPSVIEDRQALLFTVLRQANVGLDWATAQIWVKDLTTGDRKMLLENGSDARYLPTGHLVFARDAVLMAVPFDVDRLEVSGTPVPVVEGVHHSVYGGNTGSNTGAAQFAVSATGSLLYAPGGIIPSTPEGLTWIDRGGQLSPVSVEAEDWVQLRLSTDGTRLLAFLGRNPDDVWLYDLTRGTRTRQTFEGMNAVPIWLPDGKRVIFSSVRNDTAGVFIKPIDSGAGARKLLPRGYPADVTPDGKELIYLDWEDDGSINIWIAPIDDPEQAKPFMDTPFLEAFPSLSPDGRWLAYTSDETGQTEVYVQSYPEPGARSQISDGEGYAPAWSPDGTEIYYTRGIEGQVEYLVAELTETDARLVADKPSLISAGFFGSTGPLRFHDIGPDGRIITSLRPTEDERLQSRRAFAPTRLHLVQNWLAELEGED